jgi:hypothetical protein
MKAPHDGRSVGLEALMVGALILAVAAPDLISLIGWLAS